MSTNRFFTAFVVIVLVAVIALTVREAFATKAVGEVDRTSNAIDQVHASRSLSSIQADRSYDLIDQMHAARRYEVAVQNPANVYRRGEWYCINLSQPICRQ